MSRQRKYTSVYLTLLSIIVFFGSNVSCVFAQDCNGNSIDDACDIDCGTVGGPCDVPDCGLSADCNSNGIPDECDIVFLGTVLVGDKDDFDDADGDGVADLGTGDSENYPGLGSGETSGAGELYTDVTISAGTDYSYDFTLPANFFSSATLRVFHFDADGSSGWPTAPILLNGDDSTFRMTLVTHTSSFNPGYVHFDEFVMNTSHLLTFVEGNLTVTLNGDNASNDGAVLDFMEVEYTLSDCNGNGVPDDCDITSGTSDDCNLNLLPDECEISIGFSSDCNTNTTPDGCDLDPSDPDGNGQVSSDCNVNGIPDECEADCNVNGVPDDCDIDVTDPDGNGQVSKDCNDNGIPDECDLDPSDPDGNGQVSSDCNVDAIPDECPLCPVVELVFIMDTSTSMDDEASALCSTINQVITDLATDDIVINETLLGIDENPGGGFSCLTDNVINVFGDIVPGSPPPGNETLGDCPGGGEIASEDWGRAVSVVAGTKSWLADSVRLIVPIGDEGPWCGDPALEVGNDRESIVHAITTATTHEVIVSPVTGTGSSQAVINFAVMLANGTGGTQFSSAVPAEDIADGLKAIIRDACDSIFDCNDNDIPDVCDIDPTDPDGDGIVIPDCNSNAIPDDCEVDCNTNTIPDDCDVDPTDPDGNGQVSSDCQPNGIPDECDPDCNDNFVPDACDINGGTSTDCNVDGIPDECNYQGIQIIGDKDDFDDADGDGLPDLVSDDAVSYPGLGTGAASGYGEAHTDVKMQIGDYVYNYSLPQNLYDSATLRFFHFDMDVPSGWGSTLILIDGLDLGSNFTVVPLTSSFDPGYVYLDEFTLPTDHLLELTDGNLDLTLDGQGGSDAAVIDFVELEYTLSDCNSNGLLDECDVSSGYSDDCNVNNIPDDCEIGVGYVEDCNTNSIPDDCDLDPTDPDGNGSVSANCNANGIPDECETDCNVNGVPDDCDLVAGTSGDCNDNSVPDECDITMGTSEDCNEDDRPDECPTCPEVELIFVMDSSTSMDDEAAVICNDLNQIISDLLADGITVNESILGISDTAYSCLSDSVMNYYGTTVPGCTSDCTLGDCPGSPEVASEDWGRGFSCSRIPGLVTKFSPLNYTD